MQKLHEIEGGCPTFLGKIHQNRVGGVFFDHFWKMYHIFQIFIQTPCLNWTFYANIIKNVSKLVAAECRQPLRGSHLI